jgi:hypothetical protein
VASGTTQAYDEFSLKTKFLVAKYTGTIRVKTSITATA